jgi:hypothetical protein
MIAKIKNFPIKTILIIGGLIIYLALAQFSEYWLGVVTNHEIGEDFHIYYNAYIKAVVGENPYLPYNIGNSFINHPFVLSFLSLFSWHQERFLATFFWIIVSAITWVFLIGLVFHGVRVTVIDDKAERITWYFGWVLVLFLGFAPFWETIHIGQINIFVMLCLYLMFYGFEQNQSILSGVFLALAVVLKTSPAIFIFYYLILRKFKILISCFIALIILSLIPIIQFSPSVFTDFLAILPELSSEIHPTSYNQSVLSLSFRTFTLFGLEGIEAVLIIGHKIVMLCAFGTVLFLALKNSSTKMANLWTFTLLLLTMTLFSPLVWYHHAVFLIVPLVILILHPNPHYFVMSVVIIFIIQFERFFEYNVANFAYPILLAEFSLLGLGLWIYYNDTYGSPRRETT